MEHDRSHYRPHESEGSGTSPEQQRAPYSQAARYHRERAAVRAYQQAQSLIYREDADLSAFRFHVEEMWHVAVVGEEPSEEIQGQIERTLSSGEAIPLHQECSPCSGNDAARHKRLDHGLRATIDLEGPIVCQRRTEVSNHDEQG